ncbi:DUF350 domain-containing protein [bacterium]|nr:DUF350 domain-containing protein [bacterium]MCI0603592.1 DUF350 domain-containing protein [bacterium]
MRRLILSALFVMVLLFSTPLIAENGGSWRPNTFLMSIVSTMVFGAIGIVMAIVGFKVFDLVTPFNLEQEICEKQNLAVSILCGAFIIGVCIIIAVAVI